MGSNRRSTCAKDVESLCMRRRETCEDTSTAPHLSTLLQGNNVYKPHSIHWLPSIIPQPLFPAFYRELPLVNTSFTQFPQPLLLLQRKEI